MGERRDARGQGGRAGCCPTRWTHSEIRERGTRRSQMRLVNDMEDVSLDYASEETRGDKEADVLVLSNLNKI